MPQVNTIQKKIRKVEGFDVTIKKADGSELRSNYRLKTDYDYKRGAEGKRTVAWWKKTRFAKKFPGFAVEVLLGDGSVVASGGRRLKGIRASYSD